MIQHTQPLTANNLLAVGLFVLTDERWGYLALVALGEVILLFKNHSACGVNHNCLPAYMSQFMGQVTQTLSWRTGVGDVRPRTFPKCIANTRMDGAAPGLTRPTLTTRGQPLIAQCPRGYKRPTTE